jgi:hypothetical protein
LQGSPLLEVLEINGFHFQEEHCRALATLPRTGLNIKFIECSFQPQDAADTFIEWFRNNQVVTELKRCRMGSRIISAALNGNHSLEKLTIRSRSSECSEEQMNSLIHSLPGNIGMRDLTIFDFAEASDETWNLLFLSLSTHPRMMNLILHNTLPRPSDRTPQLSALSKTARMNAIIQMLYLNTVLHTIHLPDACNNEEVYQSSILPRLEMNRSCFEVQRQAVKQADPAIRPQLLGRALHAVRYNSNLVFLFLFLSENVPAFSRLDRRN